MTYRANHPPRYPPLRTAAEIIQAGAEMAARYHQNRPPTGFDYCVRYDPGSYPHYELRIRCDAWHTRITYKLYDDGPEEKFGHCWEGKTSVFLADPVRIAEQAEAIPLQIRAEAIIKKIHSE